jgi:uncharacterized repeat protein (TIGR03803 family)
MKGRIGEMFSVVMLALFSTLGQSQTFSVLYNFGTNSGDPQRPGTSVTQGRNGHLYSTSPQGGAFGDGTVFEITPQGNLSVLYNFDGTAGSSPFAGLTLGTDGNFYGAAWLGGKFGFGTVYKITPQGIVTVLHDFESGVDGANPYVPPIQATDGSFYGTTGAGGVQNLGTIYKMTPSGQLTVLYRFDGGLSGSIPYAGLVQGPDGDFYGTASAGGRNHDGTIFKITPTGILTVLYTFIFTDGSQPYAGLVEGVDGNFYGSTLSGPAGGVVYRITPKGA